MDGVSPECGRTGRPGGPIEVTMTATTAVFLPVPVIAGMFPGGGELWIILALALLFFGASRLPGIARSLGKSVNEFKGGLREGREEGAKPESAGTGTGGSAVEKN